MEHYEQIRELRIQLFCMLRLSQRALDYSIKGYRLSQSDFSRHVRNSELELELQHRKIKSLCGRLIGDTNLGSSDFRFALVALRLSRALNTTYNLATQIAQDTILYLESNSAAQCETLDRLGERVNALVRLCVVALFNQETAHAKAVLQSDGVWKRYEFVFDSEHEPANDDRRARDLFEVAVVRNLGLVAKQAHEMADAILFWLQESEDPIELEADQHRELNALIALTESMGPQEREPGD